MLPDFAPCKRAIIDIRCLTPCADAFATKEVLPPARDSAAANFASCGFSTAASSTPLEQSFDALPAPA